VSVRTEHGRPQFFERYSFVGGVLIDRRDDGAFFSHSYDAHDELQTHLTQNAH